MSWVQQPHVSASAPTAAANQPTQYQQQQQQHQHQLTTPLTNVQYQLQQQQQQQQPNQPKALPHFPQQQQPGATFSSKTALTRSMPAPPATLPNAALSNLNHLQSNMQQSLPTQFTAAPQQQQQQQQMPQQLPPQAQLNTWQPQQQNYQQTFNNNNAMQPAMANVNNWQQQQPSNVAQTAAFQSTTQNWSQPQQQQQQQQPNTYENYFAQGLQQQQPPPQQQQQPQPLYQQNDLNATTNQQQQVASQQQQQQPTLQPQQQQQQPQYHYNDFYDNSNNNGNTNPNNITNNNKSNDGWGDWGDWNDNNVANNQSVVKEAVTSPAMQTPTTTVPTSTNNIIEDSFNIQNKSNNNDSWQWNIQEQSNVEQQTVASSNQQQQNQQQQLEQNKIADFALITSKPTSSSSGQVVKPPPNTLPLNAFTADHNTNVGNQTVTPATTANIPNSVYVTQAKPVTRPSRQFASPPTGNTPVEAPEHSLLMPQPPQAFQNDMLNQIAASPPTISTTLPSTIPPLPLPSAGMGAGATAASANPFKRAGAVKHHRADLLPAASAPNSFAMAPPPPPADFANPGNLQPDNSEILHENQEVIRPPAPLLLTGSGAGASTVVAHVPTLNMEPSQHSVNLINDERNQYMQTSQLSEHQDEELNAEIDSLPPPGLSRLVLGEPELETTNQRLVTGTEEPIGNMALTSLNMEERHADGEDTTVEQMPNLTLPNQRGASNIAIGSSADRNLYAVLGESNLNNDRRIVTGVETGESGSSTLVSITASQQLRSDQREVELDGENLEDERPSVTSLAAVTSRNEPPLEGAASNGEHSAAVVAPSAAECADVSRQYDKHQSKSSTGRSLSNASTGNDSDFELLDPPPSHLQQSQRHKTTRNASAKHGANELSGERHHNADKTRRSEKQRSAERSFGSEEASVEYSTDQERERRTHRGQREGSARGSEHDNDDRGQRQDRQRKRDKREHLSAAEREHERYYSKQQSAANVSGRSDYSRRSQRGQRERERDYEREPPRRSNKHEKDANRSERLDDRERDRDRDPRDNRHDRHRGSTKRAGERADRSAREDYNTLERQRRRGERNHTREYDEYRKQSSRNARDSDTEKEQQQQRYTTRNAGKNQVPDARYDSHLMYGYPNPSQYDPYKYYYETLARTNPQAYHEWYKKYYEQQKQLMAAMAGNQQQAGVSGNVSSTIESLSAANVGAANTDGRESVHSGRSSAHNEKDRYTQAYISQANQYHQRHYQPNVQFHHSQQQLHQQQQQQQQHHYHNQLQQQHKRQSFVMNSTFRGDVDSLASYGSYSRAGRLSAAHSVDNLSSISSNAFNAISNPYMGNAGANTTAGNLRYASLDRYADSRSLQFSLRDSEALLVEQQQQQQQHRSTPLQFASLHTIVSLSSGILVTIKPRVSSKGHLNNIAKLQRLGINDASRALYASFPGPLVRGLTHKKTIIDFCEEQIRVGPTETTIYARQLTPRSVEKYRASYTLMWNLLILLLRQNGMVVGTDIAELLLKNQQQFPYQAGGNGSQSAGHRRGLSVSDDETSDNSLDAAEIKSNDDIDNDGDEMNDETKSKLDGADGDAAGTSTTTTTTNGGDDSKNVAEAQKSGAAAPQLTENEITEKFRNYLLYGNVNEALDWATDNNLWGHALFLASKVDRRSHANVMMKFANKLSLNDPLQTLYQLMSGRTPSSVTSVQDEKWGDWRPHLSMILSNTSQKPELDRKAITTLGDSLFNRGDLYAAHFCYLMAQVSFGRYQESAVQETSLQQNLPKLVLLGSSHYKNFRDFATNESIMMTEIYEYACSLNDEKFSLIEFQSYKYLLATRLLDYGFNLKSLMYMEQISLHIARDPSRYEASFINKVFDIADRLKHFDPVLEKTLDDQQQQTNEDGNPEDLTNSLAQGFEEQKWLQTLRTIALQNKLDYPVPTASYPSHDYTQQQQLQQNDQHQQDSNYLQNQINQEFAEINKQFSELNLQYTSNDPATATTFYNPETMQQQQQSGTDPASQQQQQQPQDYNQYQAAGPTIYGNYGGATDQQPTPQQASESANTDNNYAGGYGGQQQQQLQHQQQSSFYDPNAQQSYDAYGQQNAAGYNDYWAQQQSQQQLGDELTNDNMLKNKISLESAANILSKTTTKSLTEATNTSEQKQQQTLTKKPTTTTTAPAATLNKRQLRTTFAEQFNARPSLHEQLYGTPTKKNLATTTAAVKTLKNNNNNNTRIQSGKPGQQQSMEQHTPPANDTQMTPSPFLANNNARPTISMPKSKTYDSDDENSKNQQQQQQRAANQAKKGANGTVGGQQNKNDGKIASKSTQQTNQNSGWFGGIWNKLSLKPKNQMILPDDKNPTIVWDADKKRWVNTDGEEAAEENLKPPPKMSDIMQQQQLPAAPQMQQHPQMQAPQQMQQQMQQQPQQMQQQPPQMQTMSQPHQPQQPSVADVAANHLQPMNVPLAASSPLGNYSAQAPTPSTTTATTAAPKQPSLQSNMFKMQRNRTLKNAYVDVFNPSGAPMSKAAENVLAPVMPPAAIPPGGFFVPDGSAGTAAPQEANAAYQQQQHQQQADTPQFYNPNQYGSGAY